MTQSELQRKKLTELKELARANSFKGWTALRKQELVEFLAARLSDAGSGNGAAGRPARSRRDHRPRRPQAARHPIVHHRQGRTVKSLPPLPVRALGRRRSRGSAPPARRRYDRGETRPEHDRAEAETLGTILGVDSVRTIVGTDIRGIGLTGIGAVATAGE